MEDGHDIRAQRGTAQLASFSEAADVRADTQLHVLAPQRRDLGVA
jgi:hypothetical protein